MIVVSVLYISAPCSDVSSFCRWFHAPSIKCAPFQQFIVLEVKMELLQVQVLLVQVLEVKMELLQVQVLLMQVQVLEVKMELLLCCMLIFTRRIIFIIYKFTINCSVFSVLVPFLHLLHHV